MISDTLDHQHRPAKRNSASGRAVVCRGHTGLHATTKTTTSPNDFQTFGAIDPTSPRNLTGNVERPVTLSGTVNKPFAQITRVMINQQSATLSAANNAANSTQTTFSFPNFFLREGTNLVTATATDASGQIGSASLALYVDQTAPILTLEAPVNTNLAGLAMPFGKSNNNASSATNSTPTLPSAITSNNKVDIRGIVNDAVEGGLKVPYPTVIVNNATTGLTTPGKVSDRFFIVEDVPLDVGLNELTVTATDWVGNARSQRLTVSRVNVGSNRITLAGGNRQRGALNTELAKPLIVTALDKTGLPLANIPLTFEVLRGTGSINPATTSSITTTTGSGSTSITTTIPNALTGNNQPSTKPNGVNPARRLLITTDANGRAAVWFTLGKQSGEAGNMVQVSASDANGNTANSSNTDAITLSEAVLFTATGEKGLPSRLAAEGNGSQYAETGGQPLDALTAVVYDGEGNTIPGAVVAYVIESNTEAAESATFASTVNPPNTTVSSNGRVFITSADNHGRVAARPTMGSLPGTVKIVAYAFAPNTPITPALIDNVQNTQSNQTGSNVTANFQISVLQQSDGPTQYTGRVFDHKGNPLAGVRVSIGRTNLVVTTDSTGYFLFTQDIPPGKLDVFVDGRGVTGTTPLPTTNPGGQSSPTQYPSIHFEVLAVRGQVNQLAHPIYLPPLLMSEARIVGGNEDVVLQIPGYQGYEMIVKANSVTFPDGTRVGPLVVSPMQIDRLPMFPPDGWGALFAPAATLQPSGTRFDPPVELRIPNSQGLKPGERSKIYQWDQDLAQFVAMGWMTASEDGAQLITEPGSGLTKAGWHVGGTPPGPRVCAAGESISPVISALEILAVDYEPATEEPVVLLPSDDAETTAAGKQYLRAKYVAQSCGRAEFEWDLGDGTKRKGQQISIDGYADAKSYNVKVNMTCKLNSCGTELSAMKSASKKVHAVKVDFLEAWSDQFSDADANGWKKELPSGGNATGIANKPYALMGTREDDTGCVKVRFDVLGDVAGKEKAKSRLKLALAQRGTPQGDSGRDCSGPGDLKDAAPNFLGYISLKSPPYVPQSVAIGIDRNNDKKLGADEMSVHKSGWQFLMISENQYQTALAEFDAGVSLFGPLGQGWLNAFRNGTVPPGGTPDDRWEVARNQPGLSHAVGSAFPSGVWVEAKKGPSRRVTYDNTTTVVRALQSSPNFSEWIYRAITKNAAALYTGSTAQQSISLILRNKRVNGFPATADKLTLWLTSMPGISRVPPDLYAAIGDAETAEVTVRFQLSRGPATGVSGSVFYRFVVSDLNFDGTIDDLFDWDRDLTIGFPWGRMNISAFPRLGSMARAGADIQAAHLGKGSSRSGGMIFLNSYLLNGTLPGFAFEDVK